MNLWIKLSGKEMDLEPVVLLGDKLYHKSDRLFGGILYRYTIPNSIAAEVYQLKFPSPLTAAAFKDDAHILNIWLKLGLGGVCLKTQLEKERNGNPRPRVQEVRLDGEYNLINAMGLPGKGLPHLLSTLNETPFIPNRPIGISIGGHTVEEYIKNAKSALLVLPQKTHYIELNISCPNTNDGQNICKNPIHLDTILKDLREISTDHVISVKLTPDSTHDQLQKLAEIIASYEKTMINIGNTQYKTCESVGLPQTAISVGGGGLSGPALFPKTLALVKLLSEFKRPIIATGGIQSSQDVLALQEAGATLFGMATQLVKNPFVVPEINFSLSQAQRNRYT